MTSLYLLAQSSAQHQDCHLGFPKTYVVFFGKVSFKGSSMIYLRDQVFTWRKYLQRFILSLALIVLVSQLVAFPASATGVYEIPPLSVDNSTWVVDRAEVLSLVNEGRISKTLEKLAKETGNEVRFVTIRGFDYGETPQSFAQALFEKWFPTKEAQANQTLLVIEKTSNNTAIVTGDRVKSLMSDEIADSVANETLVAPLKEGEKYNQAFLDASNRLVAVLSGHPDPGAPQVATVTVVESTYKTAEETDKGNATIWVVGLLLAATIIPMATYYFYVR